MNIVVISHQSSVTSQQSSVASLSRPAERLNVETRRLRTNDWRLMTDHPARILDGTVIAAQIRAEAAPAVAAFTAKAGRPPGLAIVLVGDDPASAIYVRGKLKSAGDAGLRADLEDLPATATL